MTLQIDIHNKRKNTKLDSYVRERLDLVIGRFTDRIGHIEVYLIDENNNKGGEDKVCTIDVKLVPRGQLHVRAKQANLYTAALKAIHRAETVIAKAVDKGHRGQEIRHRNGGVRHLEAALDQEYLTNDQITDVS